MRGIITKGHISTGYNPHKYQVEVHKRRKRFNVLVCHRRWGKTVLAVNSIIDDALKSTKVNPRYGYIAPYRTQAKNVSWDIFKLYTANIPGVSYNEAELKIKFAHNGAVITLCGADNPDALRGIYLDGCVMDEMADMKPDTWTAVVRPAIADRKGWVIFIGTPKGYDLFYEMYNRGLADPDWHAALYSAEDTLLPWLDEEELANARADMPENQYRQEFLCSFEASVANALITIDLISQARGKHLTTDQFDFAAKVMGVDVARFGDDRSSISFTQGLAMFKPVIVKGMDNVALASLVNNHMSQYNPDAVFIDAGRGEGVIDYLRKLGHENIFEINFGGSASNSRFKNKRTEMWWNLKEWMEQGGSLYDDPQLVSDLVVPTYDYTPSGQIELESKKKMKERVSRSPDVGDSTALCFAETVQPRKTSYQQWKDQIISDGMVPDSEEDYDIYS